MDSADLAVTWISISLLLSVWLYFARTANNQTILHAHNTMQAKVANDEFTTLNRPMADSLRNIEKLPENRKPRCPS